MTGKITYRRAWNEAGEREDIPVYWIDGQEVTAEEYRVHFPDKEGIPMMAGISHKHWPQRSKALAVHRKQVKQGNERNARLGLSTRYDTDGTAIIPDRAERARLCKAEGVFDNNAGYGDFAGNGPAAYKGRITGDEMPDLEIPEPTIGLPITE